MTLLEQLREQLRTALTTRASYEARIDEIVAAVETRGDANLTDTETAAMAEARAAVAVIDVDRAALEGRIADLDARNEARAAADRAAAALPTAPVGSVQVRNEARTYRPAGEHSFFADLYAVQTRTGDFTAAEQRQQRHTAEVAVERRDLTVSALAGAVPPQYLLDQFAPIARAGRPFLNSLNSLSLPPDGVSFVVPRGTTGTLGAMTAEGAAFSEQDYAVTDLTSTVNLVTAQQDVSRTLFMRGGSVVDQILFPDMLAELALRSNISAINGNGTAPQHRGVLNVAGISAVTYTDASPTVGEAWPKIADAVQRINSLRFMPGTAIYVHPRRWGWVTSAVDTTGRPLFEFSRTAPNSVVGLGVAAEYGQVVGTLMGLPVITDASIPTNLGAGTNEDIIIVARSTDLLFWEGAEMSFTFEQSIGPEKVRLAVGQFQLFIPGRYPTSISTIGGTGLIAPTF